jgi:uncharacterized protein
VRVATDVLPRSTEGQQDQTLGSRVDELAAGAGAHTPETVGAEHMLDALHDQRQLTLEHEVHLLLVLVRVNATPLARLEDDQVDAEPVHPELPAQRLEALADVTVELGERDVELHHGAIIGALARFHQLALAPDGAAGILTIAMVLHATGTGPLPILGDAGTLSPLPAVVTALSTTPVKGLHICARGEVKLERGGVIENRLFYLVDESGRMVNGKRLGILSSVRADYDAATMRLSMTFPDGPQVCGVVELGADIETRLLSRMPTARLVLGPWSQAISDYTEMELRLVRADAVDGGVDRGAKGSVSLISEASVTRLQSLAGGRSVDSRRFRMLVEVAGPEAHMEDDWVGRTVRIGEALVGMRGHVGRCLVTSQSPDTGVVDLPTLELLSYRRGLETTEPLAFGVFGEVLEPGMVRVGDAVSLE